LQELQGRPPRIARLLALAHKLGATFPVAVGGVTVAVNVTGAPNVAGLGEAFKWLRSPALTGFVKFHFRRRDFLVFGSGGSTTSPGAGCFSARLRRPVGRHMGLTVTSTKREDGERVYSLKA
jgi:hypothetical protein